MNTLKKALYRLSPGRHTSDYVQQGFALPALQRSSVITRYLTVAAIMRNEGKYLAQWVEFHLMMGVEHFILYDNASTDDTRDVLQSYVRNGVVEIVPWPHFVDGLGVQALAYAHAIAHDAGASRWIAFIDLDEYLFRPSGEPLPELLKKREGFPVHIVYWLVFGASGVQAATDRLLIDAYRKRAPVPLRPGRDKILCNYKSIVQPALVKRVRGAHNFYLPDGSIGRDETGARVRRLWPRQVRVDSIRINHYYTKSIDEWEQRRSRKIASGGVISDAFLDRSFQKVHANEVDDETACAFVERLEKRLSR